MRRPTYRRAAAKRRGPDRRIIAAVAVLIAFGGVIGVTQISNADESKVAACETAADPAAPAAKGAATDPKVGTYTDKNGVVQHKGDGQLAKGEKAPAPEAAKECKEGNTVKKTVNGLEILTDTCEDSQLAPHDGFQLGNKCVSTEFGEVADAAKNPTLLITDFPESVKANTPFTLKVSTRNLVRDRFLAAGQGGYYVESSVLTAEGLVRGHFHTACRMLSSTSEAVDPAPVPAFFVATEDGKGAARPDTVTIQVPGLPQEGTAQCSSWAGDGSHRVPMMQRANQTPAFDSVRVKVEGGGGQDEPDDPPADNPPTETPTTPPADNGGGNNGGGNNNGGGGNNNGGGGNNGGDQGDDGDQPDPGDTGASEPPKTETGTTPPKSPTVSFPPADNPQQTDEPEPAKTTSKPSATKDSDSDSDEEEADTPPAQNVSGGKTSSPKPSKSKAVVADTSNDDDGAPDPAPQAVDIQATSDNESGALALTGANIITVVLGGGVLVLAGLLILSATRRRRATE